MEVIQVGALAGEEKEKDEDEEEEDGMNEFSERLTSCQCLRKNRGGDPY